MCCKVVCVVNSVKLQLPFLPLASTRPKISEVSLTYWLIIKLKLFQKEDLVLIYFTAVLGFSQRICRSLRVQLQGLWLSQPEATAAPRIPLVRRNLIRVFHLYSFFNFFDVNRYKQNKRLQTIFTTSCPSWERGCLAYMSKLPTSGPGR